MLKIKLKKARSFSRQKFIYHIIVIKAGQKPASKARERLGFFEPLVDKWENSYLFLKTDRLAFWIKRGAKLEPKVYRLIAPLIKIKTEK